MCCVDGSVKKPSFVNMCYMQAFVVSLTYDSYLYVFETADSRLAASSVSIYDALYLCVIFI